MKKVRCCLLIVAVGLFTVFTGRAWSEGELPFGAPLSDGSAGMTGKAAVTSVFRVHCPGKDRTGTGFLCRNARVLTAAHVVRDSKPEEIVVITPKGQTVGVTNAVVDEDLGLALLFTSTALEGTPLPVSSAGKGAIGSEVSVWGYPEGYRGSAPLLTVGWLSGVETAKTPKGRDLGSYVISAVFNKGNSGSPLFDVQTGGVIGMVISEPDPIPQDVERALEALKNEQFTVTFVKTERYAPKDQVPRGQLLDEVVKYIRSQTLSVTGHAVMAEDIKGFLDEHAGPDVVF